MRFDLFITLGFVLRTEAIVQNYKLSLMIDTRTTDSNWKAIWVSKEESCSKPDFHVFENASTLVEQVGEILGYMNHTGCRILKQNPRIITICENGLERKVNQIALGNNVSRGYVLQGILFNQTDTCKSYFKFWPQVGADFRTVEIQVMSDGSAVYCGPSYNSVDSDSTTICENNSLEPTKSQTTQGTTLTQSTPGEDATESTEEDEDTDTEESSANPPSNSGQTIPKINTDGSTTGQILVQLQTTGSLPSTVTSILSTNTYGTSTSVSSVMNTQADYGITSTALPVESTAITSGVPPHSATKTDEVTIGAPVAAGINGIQGTTTQVPLTTSTGTATTTQGITHDLLDTSYTNRNATKTEPLKQTTSESSPGNTIINTDSESTLGSSSTITYSTVVTSVITEGTIRDRGESTAFSSLDTITQSTNTFTQPSTKRVTETSTATNIPFTVASDDTTPSVHTESIPQTEATYTSTTTPTETTDSSESTSVMEYSLSIGTSREGLYTVPNTLPNHWLNSTESISESTSPIPSSGTITSSALSSSTKQNPETASANVPTTLEATSEMFKSTSFSTSEAKTSSGITTTDSSSTELKTTSTTITRSTTADTSLLTTGHVSTSSVVPSTTVPGTETSSQTSTIETSKSPAKSNSGVASTSTTTKTTSVTQLVTANVKNQVYSFGLG